MSGTHYTLDRDRKEEPPKEKTCRDCGVSKPNNRTFFGLKLHKTKRLEDMVTVDVCKSCKNAKTSASMKRKWADRQAQDPELASPDHKHAPVETPAERLRREENELRGTFK